MDSTENHLLLNRSPTWRVAVIMGGDSAEREISLQSGLAVSRALQEAGHQIEFLDPLNTTLTSFDWKSVDVAFIALHGTHGEDGEIQRQLDDLHVRYTSSDATASHLAFHKIAAKYAFLKAGLPTPNFRVVEPQTTLTAIHHLAGELGYPLAVKPEAQGSSLGVSILIDGSNLETAISRARDLDERILLEQAIPGEEWTVPVLDKRVLPPIHIRTPHEFFDFTAKYEDEQTQYNVITDPNHAIAQKVMQLAGDASGCLGCCGISRVDLRVDPQGQPWLLEVNTIPGMTDHSLVPKSALEIGWSMPRLCHEIIRSAFGSID